MRSVISLVSTMPDIGAGSGNEGLRPVDPLGFGKRLRGRGDLLGKALDLRNVEHGIARSEEHTSELQSLMRISYAVFCLKKKIRKHKAKNFCNNSSTLRQ